MTTSQSFINFPPPCSKRPSEQGRNRVADLESQAQLVEKLIPKFKSDHDRQFYREVVQSYRAVARDILRKAWFDDKGQDIAEYAVMLAVILVLVVGTVRLIGSHANTGVSVGGRSGQ